MYSEAALPITVHGLPRSSDIPVLFIYGLKNNAMDLCETISIIAFKKRIPWTLFMSFASRSKLKSAFEFLYRENAEYNGAEKI